MKKIGIFSGSFNPIHNGHLIVAEQMVELTELDEIWFMLTPQNPFKQKKDLLDENKRLEMVKIAIADNNKFKASDFEFNLPKPNYTFRTLVELKEKFGTLYEFSLLIGWDNYLTFDKWKNYIDIINNHKIYIYKRIVEKNKTNLLSHKNFKIVDSPIIEISGTSIRHKIDLNQSIKYLVPAEVEYTIKEKQYYKQELIEL
ncbi:UNVERIFIED_CONTAM: hypothetical protein GTU68_062697 [Idotea baltica]|nr:hypothetical protein [Idotea baltica]